MIRILASFLVSLALAISAPAQIPAEVIDQPVFIACQTGVEITDVGTGFPVKPSVIMTARHVACPPGALTFVRTADTLYAVPDAYRLDSPVADLSALYVPAVQFDTVVEFRFPLLGEKTFVYGSPLGGILTQGYIMQASATTFLASNQPHPGVSGSAVFGADGKVLGISIASRYGSHQSGVPGPQMTGGYTSSLLDYFVKTLPSISELVQ